MPGPFDAVMKQLLDACAPDWVSWLAPLFGLPPDVAVESLDPDLSTVQPVADKVFRLLPPAAGLLHIEPQTSWDGEFPGRLLLYNVLLEHRHGGPVHTVALLLRREANSPQLTGTLSRVMANGREYLRFNYSVIRVWELSADALLAGELGTTPLALLTDDAAPRLPELVTRLAERVQRDEPSQQQRAVLLSSAYILLGMRYDKAIAKALFQGVQKMRESSTYQAILEEGRAEGQQEMLLEQLRERFGVVPTEVESRVRTTTDPEKLRAALRAILHVNSPEELPL
jgi:predicted transposase YdaD